MTKSSIAVTTQPTKTTYEVGQTFNPDGMIITATWSDDTTSTVTDYTYSPTGSLSETDTTITISYTVGGITKTTTQSILVIVPIEWYTNTYQFSGWENPDKKSNTSAADFGYSGSDVKALYENKTINMVRLVPCEAGTITVRVYNDASDIVGRTDTATLRDDSKIATITITQEMVNQGGYQEIPLSKALYIGTGQFWAIQTAGDTGLFKYRAGATVPNGYRFYNKLGTTDAVVVSVEQNALCVDMGYRS